MKEFILTRASGGALKIDYENELNKEQLGVVLGGDVRCLVLAGAGSGKTRTVTYRVAYLLESGVSPDEILLLTFTNKAAKEMMGRVEGLLGGGVGRPQGSPLRVGSVWGGTFHSVANRILRKYAKLLGFGSNFTILDQMDSKDLIKLCVKELKIDTKGKRFPSPAVLQSMISYSRNASKAIEEVVEKKHPKWLDLIINIEAVAEAYDLRKRSANAFDFDDLLLKFLELLETNHSILESLSRRFRYVIVDEYQDTNIIQAKIVQRLSSYHKNLLVVGDDAQSIYSFRAAQIRNILGFTDLYDDAKVFRLEENYRSTPEILKLANEIILKNEDQYEKQLRTVCKSHEKPNLIPCSNGRQEAQYIVEQIFELIEKETPLPEIAVLFRASFHSQALEMELMKRDIPYEYRGGVKFFERAHVKDVVAYLKIFENVKDVMAWIRVLSHQVGIGGVTAGKIASEVTKVTKVKEVIEVEIANMLGVRARAGWKGFYGILEMMLATDLSPANLIRAIAGSAYQDYLEAEFPNFQDRLEDLEQFALFAEQYVSLVTFLEEVTLKDDYGAIREQDGRAEEKIILSTIHQSKGLEWDSVFVINLSEGAFPNPRAIGEEGGIEEERRLFYVAVTRARKNLFLSYPITGGYDALEIRQPSMFLQELPGELLEKVKLREGGVGMNQGRYASKRNGFGSREWEEPMIVLDDLGEVKIKEISKPRSSGFLSSVDDL